jgi:hypothetical protein
MPMRIQLCTSCLFAEGFLHAPIVQLCVPSSNCPAVCFYTIRFSSACLLFLPQQQQDLGRPISRRGGCTCMLQSVEGASDKGKRLDDQISLQ